MFSRSFAITRDQDVCNIDLHLIAYSPPPSRSECRCPSLANVPFTPIGLNNTQSVQRLVVFLIPVLTSTIIFLPPLPTSATENPDLPIPLTPLSDLPPPTPSEHPDLPFSVDRHSEEVRHYMAAFRSSRALSHACPTRTPEEVMIIQSVLNTFLRAHIGCVEKKRRVQEPIFGSCLPFFPCSHRLVVLQQCARRTRARHRTSSP
jgi:hypothetical protein